MMIIMGAKYRLFARMIEDLEQAAAEQRLFCESFTLKSTSAGQPLTLPRPGAFQPQAQAPINWDAGLGVNIPRPANPRFPTSSFENLRNHPPSPPSYRS